MGISRAVVDARVAARGAGAARRGVEVDDRVLRRKTTATN